MAGRLVPVHLTPLSVCIEDFSLWGGDTDSIYSVTFTPEIPGLVDVHYIQNPTAKRNSYARSCPCLFRLMLNSIIVIISQYLDKG